jgi:hypothetical protein
MNNNPHDTNCHKHINCNIVANFLLRSIKVEVLVIMISISLKGKTKTFGNSYYHFQ